MWGRLYTTWRLIIHVTVSRVWALVLSSKALVHAIRLLIPPGWLVSPACGRRSNQVLDPLMWCILKQDIKTGINATFSIWLLHLTISLTITIINLSTRYRTRVSRAVHWVVSSLALILTLGQHLLLLISIPVAVRALLVGRRRHRLIAFCFCGCGVGAGDGRGGVGVALRVKGAISDVAAWYGGGNAFSAGCIITIEFI